MKIATLSLVLANLVFSSHADDSPGLKSMCRLPWEGVFTWMYPTNAGVSLIYGCTTNGDNDNRPWDMLNAYRSGGEEYTHWFYTDDPKNPGCLKDWTYYAADGVTVISEIVGRLTALGADRTWCARPMYRSGGLKVWLRS